MRFKFETRATDYYVNQITKKAKEDSCKIMPTNFSLDINIEEKEILNNIYNNYQISIIKPITKNLKYSITGELFDIISPLLHRETLLLVSYIRLNIIYNGNYVEITEKDYIGFSGLQRNSFYNSINEAIKNKIISKTTRKSIYIVNHNMIFKGVLAEFITKYKIKYPNGCKIDDKGKVILDR